MGDRDNTSVVNYSCRPRTAYHHPKLIDEDRNTELHYAATKNDVTGVINYLENESPIVDPPNYLGWTPLMMACRRGNFETVKCLLSYKANATLKNKFGMNVFQISISSGNLELVSHLLEHLLVGGVSRRILEYTFSVASLAILFRHASVLEFVVSKYFDINRATIDTGITPFMFAHAMENEPAIALLLKHKVDTKVKNVIGHTAVDIVTIRRQIKINHYNESRIMAQKLAYTATQESIQNEIQNQQLRNVLQVKSDDGPTQLCSPHLQVPYVLFSPCPESPHIKFFTVPGQLMPHIRRSSNLSPFPVPSTPNVTPITPAVFDRAGGQPQIFFPPTFSPSHHHTPQVYNAGDFLNARFNSSAGMFFSPPVINFMSPCM